MKTASPEIGALPPLPELLAPAGSPAALEAAIEGGADAVYLGGAAFHARMNAQNFTKETLRDGIRTAHRFGVKVYLTLNTLLFDRELPAFLDAAYEAGSLGADALIVADLGGAAAIRREMPNLALHASTQMVGHNADFCKLCAEHGFTRAVLARELSLADLCTAVRESPIEIEVFCHGALCVSQSGQCLFSSLVGGRSGNRGECAQPCRLPYSGAGSACGAKKSACAYPLSLKDLSLAAHLPALIQAGISSLKIEGRMKSPAYVLGVTRIFRRLLDERRAATADDLEALGALFSRSGFTDGYLHAKPDNRMLGVRTDSDKERTRAEQLPFDGIKRKLPLSLTATLQANTPALLTLSGAAGSVSVSGAIPAPARNAPLSVADVGRSLSRFGATPYVASSLQIHLEPNLMLPVSALNALRRDAVAAYEALALEVPHCTRTSTAPQIPTGQRNKRKTAAFYLPKQATETAWRTFDLLFFPLFTAIETAEAFPLGDKEKMRRAGIVLPPVIPDRSRAQVDAALRRARALGFSHLLLGNLGHLSAAVSTGMQLHGDFRLNITNSQTVAALEALGIADAVASPELSLAGLRDLGGNTAALVYGRIPLMTLEKCVISTVADCTRCRENTVALRDRRGVIFPLLREWGHRNLLLNSLPTSMSDKQTLLTRFGIDAWHFLFTTETPAEVDGVLRAFADGTALPAPVRRIRS